MTTTPLPSGLAPGLPAQLGKYQVVRKLGEGGMGVVYEARDPLMMRSVAIKVLAGRISSDELVRERFLREAQSAGRMFAPNIVAALEVGEQDGSYYLVMELVTGGSAAEAIKDRGALDWPEATAMIADACRGLQAAHRAGLIHRDIKPGNIMRTADGVVKLADFGLAKAKEFTDHGLTQSGALVGTPSFMSPEQCMAQPVDARSDIYSLGATYYNLLTGCPPYFKNGMGATQIMFAHCHAAVPDPRVAVPNIPTEVAAVVMRSMAKSPQERFATAGEMLAALEGLLRIAKGVPDLAPTDGDPIFSSGVSTRGAKSSAEETGAQGRVQGLATASRDQGQGRFSLPLMAGAGVAGVSMIVITAWAFSGYGIAPGDPSQRSAADEPAKVDTNPTGGVTPSDATGPVAKLSVDVSVPLPPLPKWPEPPSLKPPFPKPQWPEPPFPKPQWPILPSLKKADEADPALNAKVFDQIDLLKLVDPQRDRIVVPRVKGANNWKRHPDGTLEYASDGKPGKIAALVALESRHYEVTLDFERLANAGRRLHMDIPGAPGKIVPLMFDVAGSGIVVYGRPPVWPKTDQPRHHVVVEVRRSVDSGAADEIRITLNGQKLEPWRGDLNKLGRSLEPHADFPDQLLISLYSGSAGYRIHAWQLRLLEGNARPLRRP